MWLERGKNEYIPIFVMKLNGKCSWNVIRSDGKTLGEVDCEVKR
jgi:hypothetical protein